MPEDPPTTPIRLALIGCGRRGRALARHATQIEGVEVHRYIDLDGAAAEQLASEHDGRDWSEDPNDALLRDDIEAVIIATPHEPHAELAIQAAEAGKHAFVEPPLALRHPDAVRVQQAFARTQMLCGVDFAFRAAEAVRLVRSRIPGPIALTLHATTDSLIDVWEGDAAHGGVLALVGAECLDLLCHLAGSAPVRVHAVGGRHTRRSGLPDSYGVTIRFSNGAIAQAVIGEIGSSRRRSAWWGSVSDGARVASLWNDLRSAQVDEHGRAIGQVDESTPRSDDRARMLAAFVDAVRNGQRPLATVHDGVRAAQLADAIYESMAGGGAVEV